jgi:hypothetical protein
MPSTPVFNFSIDISTREFVWVNFYIVLRMVPFQALLLLFGCTGVVAGSFALPLSLAAGFLLIILLSALYSARNQPQYRRGLHYTFNHWGMEMTGGTKDLSIPWRQIQKVRETRSLFVLYIRQNNMAVPHPIFKKNIGTPQQVAEFKAFVEQNLSAAR